MILEAPDKEGSAAMKVLVRVPVCIALSSIPQTHTEQLPLVCELTSQEFQSIKTLWSHGEQLHVEEIISEPAVE